MKEVVSSSEKSVLTRATWHNIPEDAILHSNRRESLKSYMTKTHLKKIFHNMFGLVNHHQVSEVLSLKETVVLSAIIFLLLFVLWVCVFVFTVIYFYLAYVWL
jgi:hypothetical protein